MKGLKEICANKSAALKDCDATIESLRRELSKFTELDFTRDGKRELLTEERTDELLKASEVKKSDITTIHLGTKSFDEASGLLCAKFLRECPAITHVDLSDIIAGRAEAIALEVLYQLCSSSLSDKTIFLDLSENALGEKGIRKLESSLRSLTSLESCQFFNNGLSALSMKLLCEYIPKSTLTSIKFHNNMSGDDGAIALGEMLSTNASLRVQHLQMSSCRVNKLGGAGLISGISAITNSLVSLNLNDSMFGEDFAKNLVDLFPKLTKMEDLNLKDIGLEVEALSKLVKALQDTKSMPLLKSLNLGCLEFGEDKDLCRELGKVIGSRTTLESFLAEEIELENEGAKEFITGFKECFKGSENEYHCLKELNLKLNGIHGSGGVSICEFLVEMKEVFLSLSSKEFLLELDGNCFASVVVSKCEKMMQDKFRYRVLGDFEENEASEDEDEVSLEDSVDEISGLMGSALKISS